MACACGWTAAPELPVTPMRRGRPRPDRGGGTLRARDGDAHDLVERHADAVWRFAAGMLHDPQEAEDVTQETFLRALRGRDSFRGEASERTWLLAICRHACIDRARASRTVESLEGLREKGFEPCSTDTDVASHVSDRVLLDAAIEKLPHAEREAFVLIDAMGLTSAEAGEVCGLPASTVRSRRHRAHQQLVTHMGGSEHVA